MYTIKDLADTLDGATRELRIHNMTTALLSDFNPNRAADLYQLQRAVGYLSDALNSIACYTDDLGMELRSEDLAEQERTGAPITLYGVGRIIGVTCGQVQGARDTLSLLREDLADIRDAQTAHDARQEQS